LKNFNLFAVLLPSFSFMVIKDIGVDNKTASRIEQRNDKESAVNR
jgi:hypothetical protein